MCSVYFFLCCVFVAVGAMSLFSGCILASCGSPHSLATTAYKTEIHLPKIRCARMETGELHIGFLPRCNPSSNRNNVPKMNKKQICTVI
jgi:hypothetical protein